MPFQSNGMQSEAGWTDFFSCISGRIMKKLLTGVVRYMSRLDFNRRCMLTNLIPGALVVQ